MKKIQLTQEGFEKLKEEYAQLKDVKRHEAVERLQKARAMGDLSENSEYTAAKEDLALVEGRIQELESILKDAEITDHHADTLVVEIGNTVVIENEHGKNEFLIVGEYEADPMNKKLSHTSPIGKALLGKKLGDSVMIKIPAGTTTYKIVEVR
jgi:transcription elongation factor GreA